MLKKLGSRYGKLHFVYEAGPCGYGLYRQINAAGQVCEVVSPAHTPRRAGDRVKTDRRDAVTLARLSRAGELTSVWVPDEAHEAVRDLIRAREAATKDVRQARQRIQSFLLRHGRRYAGAVWKKKHRVWLANQSFTHPAQQIAFQTYLNAMDQALERKDLIEKQIDTLVPEWSLGPVAEALQALRGVALTVAAGIVAEIGDMRRFDNPRQLMAFLGLVPGERSSGSKRGRLIVEAARGLSHAGEDGSGDDAAPAIDRHIDPRHRLEGASQIMREISPHACTRQEDADRHHRHCARACRLHLGNRAASRTESNQRLNQAARHNPRHRPGRRRRSRDPPPKCRSSTTDLRGSDRGTPTTKAPNAVPNPRMRNCATADIAPAS
jgi:transposase